jgi:DNA-binding PadR family transcriptional regulator
MKGEALKGHLDLLLMAALEPGPAHGYAIIDALRQRSEGTFDLPEGTIYPALHRLERAGFLTSRWEGETRRQRRVYALTEAGRAALAEHWRDWRQFSRGVEAVLAEVGERGKPD